MNDKSLKILLVYCTTKKYSMHQYMQGTNWLKSSFAENELEFLVRTMLNVSQQCVLVTKKDNGILGRMRLYSSKFSCCLNNMVSLAHQEKPTSKWELREHCTLLLWFYTLWELCKCSEEERPNYSSSLMKRLSYRKYFINIESDWPWSFR